MAEQLDYLDDENFDTGVAVGVTLVDFYADWCGPCRVIAPIIEELASHFDGKASIAKVDVEAAQGTAAKFGITSIPTLILFKNGEEVDRIIGVKDKATLQDVIEKAL